MKSTFEGDFGEASAALGFVSGITKTVKTDAYIADVLTYTHKRMSEEVDNYIDTIAKISPESLHHVYEWPKSWDVSGGNTARGGSPNWNETVGNANFRLWAHTITGRGANKTAGFTFLPSVRPSPVNPELVAAGVKENVHVWHWKAPAMETGLHITVTRRLAATLAFIDKEGNVRFARSTETGPAGGGKTTGRFTAAFLNWWSGASNQFFDNEIAPLLAKNLNPSGVLAQNSVRIGRRSRNKNLKIGVKQFDEAEKYAQDWVMKKAKHDYIEGPGGSRERRDNL